MKDIIRQILKEEIESRPVFYHGTSDKNLPNIKKHGLKNPYLTNNYNKAEYYADVVSQDEGGDAIIIEVNIPSKENLRVDHGELTEPVIIDGNEEDLLQKVYKEYIKQNPERYDKKYDTVDVADNDYWVSLESMGTVRYEGIIPNKFIVNVSYV